MCLEATGVAESQLRRPKAGWVAGEGQEGKVKRGLGWEPAGVLGREGNGGKAEWVRRKLLASSEAEAGPGRRRQKAAMGRVVLLSCGVGPTV